QARVALLQVGEDLAGVVGATVVDDDDLVIVGQRAQRHVRNDDQAGNGARVVVGGEEDRDAHAHRGPPRAAPSAGPPAVLAGGPTRSWGPGYKGKPGR